MTRITLASLLLAVLAVAATIACNGNDGFQTEGVADDDLEFQCTLQCSADDSLDSGIACGATAAEALVHAQARDAEEHGGRIVEQAR